MSYFAVVMANDDSCQTATLPQPFHLCPMVRVQSYVSETLVASLPIGINTGSRTAYLVEDGREDGIGISQCLFTDEDIAGVADHARLAQVVRMAEKYDWLILAWWADSLSSLVWMADMNGFQETLWDQLTNSGDVGVGYMPQWLKSHAG